MGLRIFIFLFSLSLISISSTLAQTNCNCPPHTNQIINPDFSMGNTGFNSDIPYESSCASYTYYVAAEARDKCDDPSWIDDAWDATSGDASGSYFIVNVDEEAVDEDIRIWSQDIELTATDTFNFNIKTRPILADPNIATMFLILYVDDDPVIGFPIYPNGEWQPHCWWFVAGITGTVEFNFRLNLGLTNSDFAIGFDDFYIGTCDSTPIPCEVQADWGWVTDTNCGIDFSNFSSQSTGTTDAGYFWDFGDGTNSTAAAPEHYFENSGTYEVCLTAFGLDEENTCCTDTYCQKIEYHCEAAPCKVSISDISNVSVHPATCEYQYEVTAETNRPIIGYLWTFSDGSTSTEANPSIVLNSGMQTVCVTVMLRDGDSCCTDTYCESINILCLH